MAYRRSLHAIVLKITLMCFLVEGAKFHGKSDFLKVSNSAAFVDKTLFIKAVFQPGRRILITAPRKFGKSTNLQMVKIFLSIDSLKLQKIRDIYTTLRICKEDHTFFENNFGKWPVVFLDLSTNAVILRVEDVVESISVSMHRCYEEHSYLLKSDRLDEYEKFICNNWLTDYTKMQEYDVSVALRNLVKYLNKHFNRPVIVLVDGYDDVINSAMVHVGDDLLYERVVTLVSTLLENGLDSKGVSVNLVVITGVSYLSSCGMISVKNLEIFPFLDDHPFGEFFGFSVQETDSLFDKTHTKIDDTHRDRVIECYGGYNYNKNGTVLHPWYTSEFIKTGNIIKYTDSPDFNEQLLYLLTFSNIEDCLDILLSGETFKAKIYKNISKEKIIELRDLYKQMVEESPDVNLFLTHLVELGYLSYASQNTGTGHTTEVKLPNVEVMESLLRVCKQYYTERYHLNATVECNEKTKKKHCSYIWTKLKEFMKSLLPKR